jgi:PAS domain S-box-containing protein
LARSLAQLQREADERERAQKSLAQSEERFRLISELTSDYAFSFSVAPDGALGIEWFSEAFTRITGYTPEEVKNWDSLDIFIHPDDRAQSDERIARIPTGEPSVSEFRVITKGGDIRWVRSYIRPVYDTQSGRVARIYGATQDITDQKRAAETLLEQERSLQSIYRASPIGIGVVVNRVFTMVNDRVCDMTAIPAKSCWAATRDDLSERGGIRRVGRDIYGDATRWGVGMDETRWQTKDGRGLDILLGLCSLDPSEYVAWRNFYGARYFRSQTG